MVTQQNLLTDIQKVGRFYQPTKSADFCMTDDRFLLTDFVLLADKIGHLYRSSDIPFTDGRFADRH